MKAIKNLNLFAVGLPLTIVITYPIFKESVFVFALLSTILTGIIQVIIGLYLIYNEPLNKSLQIYIVSVLLFFIAWFVNSQIGYNDFVSCFLFSIPPILAIYLSIIIYKKVKQ